MYGFDPHQNLTLLLQYFARAQTKHDFPKGFLPPALGNPDYVAPSKATRILVICNVFLGLAVIVGVVRLAARRLHASMSWGWDDWLLIPALACTITFVAIIDAVVVKGGVGHHSYDTPLDMIRYAYRLGYVGLPVYVAAVMFLKMSIVCFIFRLTLPTDLVMRRVVFWTGMFVMLQFLVSFVMTFPLCTPFAASYDVLVQVTQPYHCVSMWKSNTAWGAVYAATDLWLVVLPIKLVWNVKMQPRKRWGIIFVFSLGFVASSLQIVKTRWVRVAYDTWDPNWNYENVLLYSTLEMCFGIIACSMPALSFMAVKLLPRSLRESEESQTFGSAFVPARLSSYMHSDMEDKYLSDILNEKSPMGTKPFTGHTETVINSAFVTAESSPDTRPIWERQLPRSEQIPPYRPRRHLSSSASQRRPLTPAIETSEGSAASFPLEKDAVSIELPIQQPEKAKLDDTM